MKELFVLALLITTINTQSTVRPSSSSIGECFKSRLVELVNTVTCVVSNLENLQESSTNKLDTVNAAVVNLAKVIPTDFFALLSHRLTSNTSAGTIVGSLFDFFAAVPGFVSKNVSKAVDSFVIVVSDAAKEYVSDIEETNRSLGEKCGGDLNVLEYFKWAPKMLQCVVS